ncbi:MAG: putative toxin-antitoxin system toxin component, PIN family [Verrucomicrobiota bacterium]
MISGSLWHGNPDRLLDAVKAGKLALVQTPRLWVEFVEVLNRPKLAARLRLLGLSPTMLAEGLREYVTWSADAQISLPPELRDPKDLIVLAAAVAARVDAIVTGDGDLTSLKSFEGIPIMKAREALKELGLPAE